MGVRKNKSAVDAVALLIYKVQKRWKKGEKAVTLFIDIKDAFDHVSRRKLAERIINLGIDKNLVVWI